jgi:hypothetical protein
MKKSLIILIILIVLAGVWLGLRFLIIGNEEPVVCTMDAKECPDGSYVGRVPPKCEFMPCPKENLIKIESPKANEKVSGPISIKGEARGNWFFEATFPVKLYDEKNNLIARGYAMAKGDWMTENFVPFEADLPFSVEKEQRGILVLEKDNPSGLPEYDDEIRIPIVLTPLSKTVKLYYYNPQLDRDESGNTACSRKGLVAIERKISITQTPIQDTIKLLLKGKENLTEDDLARGITTEYPLEGFSLKGASLKDGILTLEFDDLQNKTVGGSCRVGILWFQIEATARQFPEVRQIRFLPEELFQP